MYGHALLQAEDTKPATSGSGFLTFALPIPMYQWFATAGVVNPYSFYTLTKHENNGDIVSWTMDGVEYTCATITFKTTVNIPD